MLVLRVKQTTVLQMDNLLPTTHWPSPTVYTNTNPCCPACFCTTTASWATSRSPASTWTSRATTTSTSSSTTSPPDSSSSCPGPHSLFHLRYSQPELQYLDNWVWWAVCERQRPNQILVWRARAAILGWCQQTHQQYRVSQNYDWKVIASGMESNWVYNIILSWCQ